MPRFDGTGPNGQGPRTGRGMGPCCKPRGRGHWHYCSEPIELNSAQKAKVLQAEKAEVEAELNQIDKELKELEKNK